MRSTKDAAEPQATARQRDLELIAFGYALSREGEAGRERVLGSLEPGVCSAEIGELMDGLRTRSPEAVKNWLAERGAVMESGKDVIQAVLDEILNVRRRQKIKELTSRVRYIAQTYELPIMRAKLAEVIEQIDQMSQ